MLKLVAAAVAAAGALLVLRKRSAATGDADLWAEATRGPDAVRTAQR